MDIDAAVAMARAEVRRHGLDGWTVVVTRARVQAGVCRFDRRQIGLSGPLTQLHDEATVRDTILHEIAHALVGPRHGHGPEWQRVARSIGASGARCVPQDAPRVPGAWVGTCPNGHRVTRHRRPVRVQSCARCRRGFSMAVLLQWQHHGRPAAMHPKYLAELEWLQRREVSRAARR